MSNVLSGILQPSFPQQRNSTWTQELSLYSHNVLNLSYNCVYCGSKMRCFSTFSVTEDESKKEKRICTHLSNGLVIDLHFQFYTNY